MSQATLERPASAATRKPAKAKPQPGGPVGHFDQITAFFKQLQAGIAGFVEFGDGDCPGRTVEIAGRIVDSAAVLFATNDEDDCDASYGEMMDADSLVQAAAALVEKNSTEHPGPENTAVYMMAQRLVEQSDVICDALENHRLDLTRARTGRTDGAKPAPVAPAAEPVVVIAASDADERHELARQATCQIETLVHILLDFGRRVDADTTHVHLPLVVKALGTRIEQLNIAVLDAIDERSGADVADIAQQINGTSAQLLTKI
jgi:hypothetical protein